MHKIALVCLLLLTHWKSRACLNEFTTTSKGEVIEKEGKWITWKPNTIFDDPQLLKESQLLSDSLSLLYHYQLHSDLGVKLLKLENQQLKKQHLNKNKWIIF